MNGSGLPHLLIRLAAVLRAVHEQNYRPAAHRESDPFADKLFSFFELKKLAAMRPQADAMPACVLQCATVTRMLAI